MFQGWAIRYEQGLGTMVCHSSGSGWISSIASLFHGAFVISLLISLVMAPVSFVVGSVFVSVRSFSPAGGGCAATDRFSPFPFPSDRRIGVS